MKKILLIGGNGHWYYAEPGFGRAPTSKLLMVVFFVTGKLV